MKELESFRVFHFSSSLNFGWGLVRTWLQCMCTRVFGVSAPYNVISFQSVQPVLLLEILNFRIFFFFLVCVAQSNKLKTLEDSAFYWLAFNYLIPIKNHLLCPFFWTSNVEIICHFHILGGSACARPIRLGEWEFNVLFRAMQQIIFLTTFVDFNHHRN